jgi:hypothetical protein
MVSNTTLAEKLRQEINAMERERHESCKAAELMPSYENILRYVKAIAALGEEEVKVNWGRNDIDTQSLVEDASNRLYDDGFIVNTYWYVMTIEIPQH